MTSETWQAVLVGSLALNAVIGLGYRVYRLTKGGHAADVWGQAVLGVILAAMALGLAAGIEWVRWPALAYGAVFAVVVMPVWVLGVLIPMPPGRVDYAFTAVYWIALAATVVAAIAL